MEGTEVGVGGAPSRTGRVAAVVIAGLLPWAWFLLRDRLGLVTDVLAILLPMLALIVALVVGVLGRRRPGAVAFAVSTLLVGIVGTVGPWIPHGSGTVDPSRAVRFAAANIGAGELEGADELIAQKADVLVISEIGQPLTERLSEEYPEHVAYWNGPSVGVFSRWPMTVLEPPGPDLPGYMLRVHAPSGDFDLLAVHVPKPWYSSGGSSYNTPANTIPYQTTVANHHRLIEQLALRARRDDHPVVIAGDLNTTDRGRDYRVLADPLHDAMLNGWGRPSQIGRWAALFVRIDHLFLKPGWCSDDTAWYTVPASDHHGLVATIGPCKT
ncbi:endonuclease/exonuclease/phosphatase family protein [Kribbella sp. NPDC051586]|uniref:endonuclease/exonuclease/phosphatase family protein n=1 Tax=Kribbella sp. NPDC051586 TaxID=3364118 RepID=UPI003789BC65